MSLRRCLADLDTQLAATLRPHGIGTLEYEILRCLAQTRDRALTGRQICQRTGARSGSVTRLIDHLEASGLLRRQRSTTDRRAIYIHLTDAGATLVALVTAPFLQARRTAAARMGIAIDAAGTVRLPPRPS